MAKSLTLLVPSVSLMLVALLLLAACGADPTATPTAAPTATPTTAPEAMPTAAPADTATAEPEDTTTAAPTAAPAETAPLTATSTPRPTPTPTPTPVPGFDAEAYFNGKTIRIVTEGSLGGGTWTMVQLLAQKWAPLIPGQPRIVLQHLRPPIAAMNRVWNADPDGLTLYASSTNRLPDELDPQAEFKSTGWSYVGAHQAGTSGYVVTRDSPYTSFVDAIGQLGSGGELIRVGIEEASPEQLLPGSTFNLFLLRDMLGIPLDIITVPEIGATTTALLMVERGELDMIHVSNTWAQLPQLREGWIAQGVVIPFLNVGDPDAIPDTPEGPWTAPHITEFLEGDDLTLWNGLNATELFYRKAIMGPEGVPAEVLDALRASYAELIVDPEFIDLFTRATGDAPTLMTGQFLQDRSETLMGAYLDAVPQVATLRERLWADARG